MYHEDNFKDSWGKNYVYRLIFEELLSPEEVETINKFANRVWRAKQEATRYEKAEKIAAADYDGWIFTESTGHNEGYFESVGEYLEWAEEENYDLDETDGDYIHPESYLWATNSSPCCALDLDGILENATQDTYEDFEIDSLKGLEELKNAIDKFNHSNKDKIAYEQNKKLVIIL